MTGSENPFPVRCRSCPLQFTGKKRDPIFPRASLYRKGSQIAHEVRIGFTVRPSQTLVREIHIHERASSEEGINLRKRGVHAVLGLIKQTFLANSCFVPIWTSI